MLDNDTIGLIITIVGAIVYVLKKGGKYVSNK